LLPRFKPALGGAELAALGPAPGGAVERFECAFARQFEAAEAIAFPYGRTALWALFKALAIEGQEIVMPAYTCVVVAHATMLSGNTCRFVDVTLDDYNMDLDALEAAISERTGAILATHLFGYPLNLDRFRAVIEAAERRLGKKMLVVHDCAHAFGARWKGQLVWRDGDVGLFGLGISKLITSIFGGMLTLSNRELAGKVRAWRDEHLRSAGFVKAIVRRAYLAAVYPAFSAAVYPMVRWLTDETPLLDGLAKAYHLDDQIRFPPDYLDRMVGVEAAVGIAQLRKYPEIVRRRVEHATQYDLTLPRRPDWVLPPIVEGATYSHYVVRVPERKPVVERFERRGVQVGQVIEYSVPHMRAYGPRPSTCFPNSWLASQTLINLPVHAGLSDSQRMKVVECFNGLL
jgi:dTDP-4-amino-4,6-dideoxygalactose transaminase